MFIEFFCIGCLAIVLFSFGKITSESVGKKLKNLSYTKPITVKNKRNSDGRFRVVNAWYESYGNWYCAEIRVKEGTRLKIQSHTMEGLEEGIVENYKQLENREDYFNKGLRIEVKDFD